MSDFDKEAERERLREKYEEDEEDREATQRMSQLLLQGATMTNQHCDACGDPVFRHEGREFCPTCQEEREDGAPEDGDGTAAARQPEVDDQGADADTRDGQTVRPQQPQQAQSQQPQQAQSQQPQQAQPQQPQQPQQAQNRQPRGGQPQSGAAGSAADLNEARQSLARTLTVAARRAENAEDPQTATAYLEAAREAAEALAALRGQ